MKIKRKILRGIALALAAFLLCASVGFNVDFHYCSGKLKSYSFLGKAESCHNKEGKFCPVHQKVMLMGKTEKFSCCKNESVYFQSDQDLQFEATKLKENLQFEKSVSPPALFLTLAAYAFTGENFHPPPESNPPQKGKDIRVRIQSFLC